DIARVLGFIQNDADVFSLGLQTYSPFSTADQKTGFRNGTDRENSSDYSFAVMTVFCYFSPA
ncbi:MAG TPA: hypothetical protein PLZ82_08580, partial [Smithellaceae bacterium]|nr:hypothetical protein [Smithellaceae bacterium]HPI51738.1 hypothetical protein [Smithellaceae bacterium]HQH05443.1 hypothetical protein [Smithellaceae bacterium]HQJ78388.1 hypothetical protein [Smithellaceae bacterium]